MTGCCTKIHQISIVKSNLNFTRVHAAVSVQLAAATMNQNKDTTNLHRFLLCFARNRNKRKKHFFVSWEFCFQDFVLFISGLCEFPFPSTLAALQFLVGSPR